VIRTFGNALAEDLFNDRMSRAVRQFPAERRTNARRKLQMLDDMDTLQVLMALPSNRLEKLKGDRRGCYSTGSTFSGGSCFGGKTVTPWMSVLRITIKEVQP